MSNVPPDYMETQRSVNLGHSNGLVENDDDGTLALDFIEWVEESHLSFDSILVVGCRTGYEVSFFRGHWDSASIIGVDIVPEFVKQANLRGRPALVADMHSLPFEDALFDLVFCVGALEHAYDAPRAIREMQRVARRAVFCDAELETPTSHLNTSNFTFIPDPQVWASLFQDPPWSADWRRVSDSVYIWAWRDPTAHLTLSTLRSIS